MIKLVDTNIYEREILSFLMNKRNYKDKIITRVNDDYFSEGFNRRFYKACKSLIKKDVPIDINTIVSEMQLLGLYEVGDFIKLNEINESCTSEGSLEYYLSNLEAAYESNTCKKKMMNYLSQDKVISPSVIINELEDIIICSREEKSLARLQENFLADLETRMKSEKVLPLGLLTGFIDLDSITRGIVPGSIVTIQARSGIGKTTFNIELAKKLAQKKERVCYFSLEVSDEQFNLKLILSEAGAHMDDFLCITQHNDEIAEKLVHVSNEIVRLNLEIEVEINIEKIISRIMYQVKTNGTKVFFIDYLNIIQYASKNTNTDVIYNEITARLKQVALKYSIIIFLVVQTNREADKRQDKRPTLADIKSASSIEQNSDYIFALYRNIDFNHKDRREEYYRAGKLDYNRRDADYNPECFEVIVLKNRHTGECGKVGLRFRNNKLSNW